MNRLITKFQKEANNLNDTSTGQIEYHLTALSDALEQMDELGLMELEGSYGTKEE